MPKPKTAAADYVRVTMRLPREVLARLRADAAAIGWPLNTHIIALLNHCHSSGGSPSTALPEQAETRPTYRSVRAKERRRTAPARTRAPVCPM